MASFVSENRSLRMIWSFHSATLIFAYFASFTEGNLLLFKLHLSKYMMFSSVFFLTLYKPCCFSSGTLRQETTYEFLAYNLKRYVISPVFYLLTRWFFVWSHGKANESSFKMSYISDSASLVVEGDLWMQYSPVGHLVSYAAKRRESHLAELINTEPNEESTEPSTSWLHGSMPYT